MKKFGLAALAIGIFLALLRAPAAAQELPGLDGVWLVGLNGLCLDVVGNSTADGTDVDIYGCHNPLDANQIFQFTSDGLIHVYANKCLDDWTGRGANGDSIKILTCNAGDRAQHWSFNGVQIKSWNGKCVDVPRGMGIPLVRMDLWDCNGGNNQRWSAQVKMPAQTASRPPAPTRPAPPPYTPPAPVQPAAPTNLTVSPQLQQALLTNVAPFLGSSDLLTSSDPLTSSAPLTNTSPFTMPIGNNLIGNAGSGLSGYGVQSLNSAQQLFQRTFGRAPSPAEAAAVAKLQMIEQAFAQSFGRPAQSLELKYWANTQNASLGAIESYNQGLLRGNGSLRAATIQAAFHASLKRLPTATEAAAWDPVVAGSGTLYSNLVGQIGSSDQAVVQGYLRPMIAQVYNSVFGRQPQASEMQYWLQNPNLTWSSLQAACMQHLRADQGERTATIQRAFQQTGAPPTAQQMAQWDAVMAQGRENYARLVQYLVCNPGRQGARGRRGGSNPCAAAPRFGMRAGQH